jgi:hypothetical protein
MAMIQSGEQPVFRQENYLITERKPEVLERAELLKNSRWEQDIVDGCHKPKLQITSHY